jgi:hypothetical protein
MIILTHYNKYKNSLQAQYVLPQGDYLMVAFQILLIYIRVK